METIFIILRAEQNRIFFCMKLKTAWLSFEALYFYN